MEMKIYKADRVFIHLFIYVIFVYMIDIGMCVYIHVCGTVWVSWCVYGSERTTLGVCLHCQPCLRQGLLLFPAVYARLAGLSTVGNAPVSAFYLDTGPLRVHTYDTMPDSTQVRGIRTQVFPQRRRALYLLSHPLGSTPLSKCIYPT